MAVIMGTTSCLTNLLTKILWLLCAWKREKIPKLLLRDANPELPITVSIGDNSSSLMLNV